MPLDDTPPAFPSEHKVPEKAYFQATGMSQRQYAAITLRVPYSGCDWLDEMINEARRDEFAAAALTALRIQAHVATPAAEHLSASAFEIADAMMRETAP